MVLLRKKKESGVSMVDKAILCLWDYQVEMLRR